MCFAVVNIVNMFNGLLCVFNRKEREEGAKFAKSRPNIYIRYNTLCLMCSFVPFVVQKNTAIGSSAPLRENFLREILLPFTKNKLALQHNDHGST
ncbi:MAG: hypothetical protein JWP12_2081 [Bacteroidetes bacterium]|nr:hypothetical protein [Bacteroidota bacterium]